MARAQLSPAAWIDAGLERLAAEGPVALRAEPLSRHLKTSKGSFYWHFKDVPAFQMAVLDRWRSGALAALAADAESEGSSTDQLIRFAQTVQADTTGPALRAWAQTDQDVAKALAQVDQARIDRLTKLLHAIGLRNDDFAKAAFGTLIGLQQTHVDNGDALVAYGALIDVILAST
ncbi:MAG: TetR/AcrR family transcriptional regulator [Pseudomonadota bacterium]